MISRFPAFAAALTCATSLSPARAEEPTAATRPETGEWDAAAPPEGAPNSPVLPESPRRFSVSLSLGTTSSGPAGDIEKAMVAAGLNQHAPSFFGLGGNEHPFSRTGIGAVGVPWMIAVGYAPTPLLLLRTILSNAPIGETFGYNGAFLFVAYSTVTVAPTASLQLANVFHLGIGPAIYVANARQDEATSNPRHTSETRLGAILDVGLSVPAHSMFFVVGSFQYRYVGKATIGPFEDQLGGSTATMPSTEVRYDHGFGAVGLGVRL